MNRHIELGSVMRKVFRIYVDQASVLMPAAAVVFVITGIVTELIVATGSGALALVTLVIDLVAGTLFTGMVVELVADVQNGRRDHKALQLLRAVTPVLGQLIIVGIVTGILEGIGFVLILVPGLILMTIWSVVAPVVVVENPGGLRSLGRSRDLVRGNGPQVFGVIIVLVIGVYVASALIDAAAASAPSGVHIVVRVVVGILAAPISALAAAVLYFELRGQRPEPAPFGPLPPIDETVPQEEDTDGPRAEWAERRIGPALRPRPQRLGLSPSCRRRGHP